jgi:hypothetical protein
MTDICQYDDEGRLIMQCCRELTHVKASPKVNKNFVKRMEFDVVKRGSRDQAISKLKEKYL